VSWYIVIDIIFVGLVIYFSKFAYEKKYYIKFFEYFKIFVAVVIASKLAPYTGFILQKLYITQADTYITLLIISFGLNVILIYYFWKNLIKAVDNFIPTSKLKIISAKVLSFVEVLVFMSLFLYFIMQIYLIKITLQPIMKNTYSYTYITKFYHKFLNEDILAILEGSSTGTNSKEVLFKTFTNSI
jgi:hypothetical protein